MIYNYKKNRLVITNINAKMCVANRCDVGLFHSSVICWQEYILYEVLYIFCDFETAIECVNNN